MRLLAALVFGLALLGAACGGGPATIYTTDAAGFGDAAVASCTIVQFVDGGAGTLCFETLADVGPTFQQTCTQNGMAVPPDAGTEAFTNGPCLRDDALGACQTNVDGLIENQWYYKSGRDSGTSVFGQTASDIMSLCAGMGATYLSP